MDVEPKALWPIDDAMRANIKRIVGILDGIDETTGGWTTKAQARLSGITLTCKFRKKADVMFALSFINMLEQCPGLLLDALERLLAADDARKEADADSTPSSS